MAPERAVRKSANQLRVNQRRAKLKGLELEEKCVELATLGLSTRKIAELLGCSHTTAERHLHHALEVKIAEIGEKGDGLRARELAKCDEWERRASAVLTRKHLMFYQGEPVSLLLPADADAPDDQVVIVDVLNKDSGEYERVKARRVGVIDDGPTLNAIATLLRVAERRAKLLGLDQPSRTELSGPDGGPIQIAAAAQEAREHLAAKLQAIHRARAEVEA